MTARGGKIAFKIVQKLLVALKAPRSPLHSHSHTGTLGRGGEVERGTCCILECCAVTCLPSYIKFIQIACTPFAKRCHCSNSILQFFGNGNPRL